MKITRHAQLVAVTVLGLGLLAVAVVLFYLTTQKSPDAAAPALTASSRVSIVDGVTAVNLDEATQRQSGVRTEPLVASTHRTGLTAYGTVLDLQPLIDSRIRHEAALAAALAAQAAAAASRAEFERNRSLYQDDRNVSLKAYQAAQARYQSDQAKADAATLNVRNIEGSVRQQFGEPLARWALDPHSPQFARLMGRQDVVARITLPAGGSLRASDVIQVRGNGSEQWPGYLVSPAAQNDPSLAGSGFIYRVPAPIATGTPLVAFLPTSTGVTQGTQVPSDAVVWYAGQPWIYVQTGPTRFARRPLGQAAESDGGFFATGGFKAGERVVTSGAQLLLSEEQRPPPTSTACKDPECD